MSTREHENARGKRHSAVWVENASRFEAVVRGFECPACDARVVKCVRRVGEFHSFECGVCGFVWDSGWSG